LVGILHHNRWHDSQPNPGARAMNLHSILLQPIISLLAGILILVQPSLLNYIVAIYLIIVGVLGLAPHFMQ
jgi:hypothetical protein